MKTIPSFLSRPLVLAAASRRDVTRRASAIWRDTGRPKNRDVAIWLEAERDVEACNRLRTGGDMMLGGQGGARAARHRSATSV